MASTDLSSVDWGVWERSLGEDPPTRDIPKLVAWAATVAFCFGFWTGVVLLVVSGA